MKYYFITISFLHLLLTFEVKAQNNPSVQRKFFVTTGFGLAGNHFVRTYEEALPFPSSGYQAFLKKKFLGTGADIAIGLRLKKGGTLKVGYRRDRFTRQVNVADTLQNAVGVLFDHKIYHFNNIWYGGYAKHYTRPKSEVSWGAGLYYLRPEQQEVEVFGNFIINKERNHKNSRLNEGGIYGEFAYAYRFQPKVNLGLKTQVFYTASASYLESVSLFPFIELNF